MLRKALKGTLFVGWMAGATYLGVRQEEYKLKEFQRKYPGETPKRVWQPQGKFGHWEVERQEENQSSLKR